MRNVFSHLILGYISVLYISTILSQPHYKIKLHLHRSDLPL